MQQQPNSLLPPPLVSLLPHPPSDEYASLFSPFLTDEELDGELFTFYKVKCCLLGLEGAEKAYESWLRGCTPEELRVIVSMVVEGKKAEKKAEEEAKTRSFRRSRFLYEKIKAFEDTERATYEAKVKSITTAYGLDGEREEEKRGERV